MLVFFFSSAYPQENVPPIPTDNAVGSHHHHHHHNVWDSRLPEVGAPYPIDLGSAGEGGAADGDGAPPYRGFGVPRVDTLYPAVCPIAIYDCTAQR